MGISLRGLFLVVMIPALFFWRDIEGAFETLGPEPVSAVDATCGPLWVQSAQNDQALSCYLTTKVERLCAEGERRHLRQTFARYDADKEAFGQAMAVVMLQTGARLNAEAAADPGGDTVAQINRATSAEAQGLKNSRIKDMMAVDILPRKTLVSQIRSLGERGYMSLDDFGASPDSLVVEAFSGVPPRRSPCSTAS